MKEKSLFWRQIVSSKSRVCSMQWRSAFPGFFPEKSGKFSVPGIQEYPLPGPVPAPPLGTGHFPFRLSRENETGIPELEILYLNSRNSRNSVLDRKFPVGY